MSVVLSNLILRCSVYFSACFLCLGFIELVEFCIYRNFQIKKKLCPLLFNFFASFLVPFPLRMKITHILSHLNVSQSSLMLFSPVCVSSWIVLLYYQVHLPFLLQCLLSNVPLIPSSVFFHLIHCSFNL